MAVVDHAYVSEALRAAEISALSLTRVELCHFLAEVQRTLGADGTDRFIRGYFRPEKLSLTDQGLEQSGDVGVRRYLPLIEAIGEPSLRMLPIYGGWKWWELYVRWNLFIGSNILSAEDETRYRGIIGNEKVLKDAGIEDAEIRTGAYRFQVDFDPDEEWIEEIALCRLSGVSEKTVAELCAQDDVETCKSDYVRTVIRVGAVREYLSTSPGFTATTFLDPDNPRIKAAISEK